MEDAKLKRKLTTGGAAQTIADMDEYQYACIGQRTFCFVRRLLQDPVLRELHAKKKAELQASGYFDRLNALVSAGQSST